MPTIGEANDINVVLRYLLNVPSPSGGVPSDERALEAAQRLAARSYKTLLAGLTPDQVTNVWQNRRGASEQAEDR